MTTGQIVVVIAGLVAPWLFVITASVQKAGLVAINTAGAGAVGMIATVGLGRMHLLTLDAAAWMTIVSASLTASGLLLFGAALWSRRWHERERQRIREDRL